MSILKAYLMPHPPLAVPSVGRGQESQIEATLSAIRRVSEEISRLTPESIIVITPHSVVYADYFHISPGKGAEGNFSRFGATSTVINAEYDISLSKEIERLAENAKIPAGELGERDKSLDHGTMVPLYYINQAYPDYKLVRIAQSGMEPATHYRLGQIIATAAKNLDRKTVLIASGDLSHKLSTEGPYGFANEGPAFDREVTEALQNADFLRLFNITDENREKAAECGYNSLMVMAGCFDGSRVKAKLLSYEGPLGVGYAVASFGPEGESDATTDHSILDRNILKQFEEEALSKSKKLRQCEDHYQALARRSLEHAISSVGTAESGNALPVPENLPPEMLDRRAGVFVSLHKNGRLRGCIGTIAPTCVNIAQEITQNAVSAGLRDHRFDPVTLDELPFLSYKVDVLSEPEPITDASTLDVKRYGVIVSSGHKRGLLLPNLDGVDTVSQQISIARQKAGVPEGAEISLERFEVVRHG